jgi:hypothetical protein
MQGTLPVCGIIRHNSEKKEIECEYDRIGAPIERHGRLHWIVRPVTLVRVVPAGDRIDRLEFSEDAEYRDHAVHLGTYCCPRCDSGVEFRTHHFREHEGTKRSNLNAEWRSRFDIARPIEASRWESFVDFHCPGCKAPVRIIYEAGQEYAMGSHPWRLVEVLEAADWPQSG